jgi:hypothetical protein
MRSPLNLTLTRIQVAFRITLSCIFNNGDDDNSVAYFDVPPLDSGNRFVYSAIIETCSLPLLVMARPQADADTDSDPEKDTQT